MTRARYTSLALLMLVACSADAGPELPGDRPDGGAGQDPVVDARPGDVSATARIVGYFVAWGVYGRDYHVADIPADKLTHVNYGFANISADGRCELGDPYADIDKFYDGDSWDSGALRGSFHQLQLLKQRHPHLRTLISVGGWTWSSRFSDVASTEASRQVFVESCVDFMMTYGFDGIDIDWEYPVGGGLPTNTTRPEDRANYTLLLQAFRERLDERAPGSLLTIAAPAGPGIYANLELDRIHDHLDWINLMSYDFHGGWDPITNFNAPMSPSAADPTPDPATRAGFNVSAAVTGYLAAGVPASELVVGVPFYGRGWAGVPPTNDGLFQSHTGLPPGTWEPGVFDYHDLAANYVGKCARHVSEEAAVPWLYCPDGVMISYDDPESLAVKRDYVRGAGLGGVMFWELSGDDQASTLLSVLGAGE
jgi:chitinase